MSDSRGGNRYFCHSCNGDIESVTEDFSCPTCNSGFVEEVNVAHDEAMDDHDHDFTDAPGPFSALLPGMLGMGMEMQGATGRPGRYHVFRQGALRPMVRGQGGPGALNPDRHLENFLQDLIFNVTGMGVAGGGGGALGPAGLSFHIVPGNQGFQITGEPGVQIHGNPGDYAWGRGGLDAIITQLLNQMDGAGPPPMAKESIKEIPTVSVDSGLLEKNPNCSVCWEDFQLEEGVKQLQCLHCFHKDCIVPWLELHGTCPVCRKVLSTEGEGADTSSRQDDSSTDSALEDDFGVGSSSSGAGGISGFIQNAFNSILGGSLASASGYSGSGEPRSSQPSVSSTSSSSSASQTSTSGSGSSASQTSTSGSGSSASQTFTSGSGSSVGGQTGSTSTAAVSSSSADEDLPASRRQRLDSDFIDFELE